VSLVGQQQLLVDLLQAVAADVLMAQVALAQ
jgi:hypothetical protein